MLKISHCHSIEDLRNAARKAIPGVMFDYIEGGAEDEITVRRNRESFAKYEFVPRVLQNVSEIDLSTQVQGLSCSMPLLCAPTGMSRLFHYQGEKAVAQAAQSAGIPYSLSTVSTISIEEIARISQGVKFFQIYVWHNRSLVLEFINRCKSSEYDGIMLSVDLVALGKRERDLRHGHGRQLMLRFKIALGALTRPAWLFRFLTSGSLKMANLTEYLPHDGDVQKTANVINDQFDATVTWNDAREFRKQWAGPFLLKGIQCVEDAKRAVAIGASGIVLSNHGGRQLDGAPPAFELLPEVVAAVGGEIEVLIDGGIRRGSDVIKAIALGATACLIGRPYLYGLAAGGEAGVNHALELLRNEMQLVMKLIGCDSLNKLNSSYVKRIK